MLFADMVGFSRLKEEDTPSFLVNFLGVIAKRHGYPVGEKVGFGAGFRIFLAALPSLLLVLIVVGVLALKNALIPTLALVGLRYGWMLGGTVLVAGVYWLAYLRGKKASG